jgi:hypothetical protein
MTDPKPPDTALTTDARQAMNMSNAELDRMLGAIHRLGVPPEETVHRTAAALMQLHLRIDPEVAASSLAALLACAMVRVHHLPPGSAPPPASRYEEVCATVRVDVPGVLAAAPDPVGAWIMIQQMILRSQDGVEYARVLARFTALVAGHAAQLAISEAPPETDAETEEGR